MSLPLLLDEHLRGVLWHALQQHNQGGINVVDVVRVGDPGAPPRGTIDPDLLVWAEGENRVIVTWDCNTMPGHLADHLAAGRHSPGVLILPRRHSLQDLVFMLVLAAYAFDPAELKDQVRFIP